MLFSFLVNRYNFCSIRAFVQSERYFLSFRQSLKTIESGFQYEFLHHFIIRRLSILWPWALFRSKLFIILAKSSVEKLTESSDLLFSFARLSVVHWVHWSAEKILKSSAFSLKFFINLFSWKRGGIAGIFYYLESFSKWTNTFSSWQQN